jgi:hypothetical protein
MLQEFTHRIGFWLKRGLFVLSATFVLLFVVEILKGHGLEPSAEFGIIWSAISTTIFLGTRIFYVSRGKNCPMCNDLPIRPKS